MALRLLARSCLCCPLEWDGLSEDEFVNGVNLEEIRTYMAGHGRGINGLTRNGKCAGCILPPKRCFCSIMCKWCLVHEDHCKCQLELKADHPLVEVVDYDSEFKVPEDLGFRSNEKKLVVSATVEEEKAKEMEKKRRGED